MIHTKNVLLSLLAVSISIPSAPTKNKANATHKKNTQAKHFSNKNTDSTQEYEIVYTPNAQVGTSPGSLDQSFGQQGLRSSQLDLNGSSIYDVTANAQGNIFTAGRSANEEHFIVTGYTPDGEIDPQFGYNGNGTNIVIFGDEYLPCGANALAIDKSNNQGKIVVAGYSGDNFGVARYLKDGTFDCTFNKESQFPGRNTIPFGITTKQGSTTKSSAHDLAVGSDGSVVMAGETIINNTNKNATKKKVLSLAKVKENGSIERSFGLNGTGTVTFSLSDNFPAIVPPDAFETIEGIGTQTVTEAGERIPYTVVAGTTEIVNAQGTTPLTQGYIARFTPQGEFNQNFGPNGTGLVLVNFTNPTTPPAQPDAINTTVHNTIIDSDDRIVVTGTTEDEFGRTLIATARYLPNGSYDLTFGTRGITNILVNDGGEGLSLAFDETKRILITGIATTQEVQQQVVIRLSENGQRDTTFGALVNPNQPNGARTGVTTTDFNNANQNAAGRGIVFQPSKNRIIAAGYNINDNEEPYSALAGYNS